MAMNQGDDSPNNQVSSRESRGIMPQWLRRVTPHWLQGAAALLAAVVSAVGLWYAISNRGSGADSTIPTISGTGSGIVSTSSGNLISQGASATLESVTVGPDEIRATGLFRDVDLQVESVLLIGQPTSDPAAEWLPVVAETSPTNRSASGRESGRWNAIRPTTGAVPYSWYAVVAPKGGGATDSYADLREKGPNSELVKALSEPFRTGG